MAATHKAKQYLFGVIKVLVLSTGFIYIGYRLRRYASEDVLQFIQSITVKNNVLFPFIFLLLLLTILNWVFEIFKWKNLVSSFERISFKVAAKQTLMALTVSLATPARVGDYGAKALFFKKEHRKKVLLLNLFSNLTQLFATVIFGFFGLIFCWSQYDIPVSKSGIAVMVCGSFLLAAILFFIKDKIRFKGFFISRMIRYFVKLSGRIQITVLILSIIRYLTFSLMFYLLLVFFGSEINLLPAFSLIFSTYLLASILPSMFIFDVVIRGSVALWLFSFEEVPGLIVLSSVFLMWFFNFVLPSLWGSIYVIKFQPATE